MPSSAIDKTSEQIYFITGTLTTVATALGASTSDLTELIIQADPDNAVNVVIGSASSQGWKLEPGDQFNCPIRNPALIYGKSASATATYSVFGRYGN